MRKFLQLCQLFGFHPLVAFGMIAIDLMLFGAEGASLGASWPISIPVSLVLTIPCALIQKYGMNESWGLACGKAFMIGLLTAIPTPLPSGITLVGGIMGIVALLSPRPNDA